MPGCRTPKLTVDEERVERIQHRITKAEAKSAKERWSQDVAKHFRIEGSEAQRMAQDRSAFGKGFLKDTLHEEKGSLLQMYRMNRENSRLQWHCLFESCRHF
ncbi:hypothetical protein PoB_003607300 [Plakobranchus ocellatus]|uniref:Uncharacterized protein n=1 Tax=Plakobranchus ocellatus TaxID=259542 RepID=A0AAV4ASM0_9GAST|nr:hypothetical protein PoB_003607300 [Plakobranchus ocellatus]